MKAEELKINEGDWSCSGCGRSYSKQDAAEYGITCGMPECGHEESPEIP